MQLIMLLAGTCLLVAVPQPDGTTAEESSTDQPVAGGADRTVARRLARAKGWAAISPEVARTPLNQRTAGESVRIDRHRLAAIRPVRDTRFLSPAHLTQQSARTTSTTADPA